jgi:hypothetical protein
VVCDAHLFILQFHVSSFGASLWGKMALFFFSATQHRETRFIFEAMKEKLF